MSYPSAEVGQLGSEAFAAVQKVSQINALIKKSNRPLCIKCFTDLSIGGVHVFYAVLAAVTSSRDLLKMR